MTEIAFQLWSSRHSTRANAAVPGWAVPHRANSARPSGFLSAPEMSWSILATCLSPDDGDDVAAVPRRAGVGLLDRRGEPDRPQQREAQLLLGGPDVRRELGRAPVCDLRADRLGVDGQQVPVGHLVELADREGLGGVALGAGGGAVLAGGRDRLVVRQPVAGTEGGSGRRRGGRRDGRGGGTVGEGSAVGVLLVRRAGGEGEHRDHQECEPPHAVVAAQQTDRRLPACHSPSWNHV